jgi:hypothetical protein
VDDGSGPGEQGASEGVTGGVDGVIRKWVPGVDDEDGKSRAGGDAGKGALPPVPATAGDAAVVAPDDLAGLVVLTYGLAAGGGVERLVAAGADQPRGAGVGGAVLAAEGQQVGLAIAGRGFDGDRYAAGAGPFCPRGDKRSGYDLTLMAAEVLDELASTGVHVDFAATRRNVLTHGIDVNALVGRTFRIGDVLCEGRRLCEPCVHLDRLSGPGLLRSLIHKGGLRADILNDGEIRPGAPIRPV